MEGNIGFIGLGAMGSPMAKRIADALTDDSQVFVYDVVEAVLDELLASNPAKIQKAASPAAVAKQATTIISMVPEGRHVRDVYLDANTGINTVDLSKHLLIDCSTIDVATNLAVKKQIQESSPGVRMYDAPVTGGVQGAEKGTLAFFLGCAESDPSFPAVQKLLKTMGRQVISCGGPSLGLVTKLTNNYLSGLIAIASSEALNMGIRAGMDPVVLSRALSAGTAQNAICDKFNPVPGVLPEAPSSHGYRGGFKVQLMKKDFALAVDMAKDVGATLALGPEGLRVYEGASNDLNCRDRDSRVVYRYLGGIEDRAHGNRSNGA
ncbi:putative 3-hydroxyisobutyrate dehydrogenase [Colletotrichum karsti]|uniref:3-hydroxyisobutyrate dehydrogenase n=1 Tax=Colletotrichum karsti TaxID=1095194 RepID=A0A9P6I938_9PEZI|nr:putative 3-hydroxyisobutyrate dehydrogenase [Colletotrichum karsti]KAF9878255.1 putative 3-hydroxyisobutyrate dehydrogenase [Colletotrichum karsti]